jgi:predicted nuclease with RNAse H fold
MKFIGIDLAGNPKNETGFCILEILTEDKKIVNTSLLHSDSEILEKIKLINPELIAIDAPLTYAGMNRKCDDELQSYGALPVTLRGMEILAKRGSNLAEQLKIQGYKYIEVYATASSKILGLHDKHEKEMQKKLLESNLSGDLDRRLLNKDELDSISCALTAYLHSLGATDEVGDADGKIIIPRV